MAIDEMGNMSITFYGELTAVPNFNNIYEITHILISSFNYESTTIKLCDSHEVPLTVFEDLLVL